MTQDINSTIVSALSAKGLGAGDLNNYSDYIEAAVDALTEREHEITDALLDIAERFGHYTRDEVESELRRSIPGLNFRPEPEPEQSPAEAFAAYLQDALKENEEDATVLITGDRMRYEAPEKESKGGKKARKAQEKRDAEERLTRLEEAVNTLADLARQHLNASI